MTTLTINLPDFVEQQPLGQDGLMDRFGGQYRGRPAVANRLIEEAARFPQVAECFLRLASDFAALSKDLYREPAKVPHAQVAEVLFHGKDSNGEPTIVVAMPQGGSRLQAAGRWSEVRALHLAAQLAETLLIANRKGLYSCALTPSSVFVLGVGEGSAPPRPMGLTLLNLGLISIEAAFYQVTGEQAVGLTDEDLAYRAPELRQDPTRIDERAEVFSLAALLHFLILGRLRAGTTSVKVGIHEEVRKLIHEMLAPDPHARPALRAVHQRIVAVISQLNDFELVQTLWESSDASLHRALQISTQRTGWLRVLTPRVSTAQRGQLGLVAQCLQETPEPGLLASWETGEQRDQSPYIFSAGSGTQTLRAYVDKHGPLGRAALLIVEGLARTVRSLHRQGLLYLGLGPDNIVVESPDAAATDSQRAQLPRCWLLQTEYSRSFRKTLSTSAQTLVEDSLTCPPAELQPFLAPEQYDPHAAVAERADVFALGSLLCFLLTGKPPPLNSIELRVELGIDKLLHGILVKLLNRMRARRSADRPTPNEAVRTLTWLARLDELMHGELLDGKYRIERPLAVGGMNALFVVSDVQLGRQAVLKCPFPDIPIAIERARQEAEAATLARRGNSAVVDILQYGELDPEVPYLLMEMVDGELLTDYFNKKGSPLAEAEVIRLGINIAGIMEEVHRKGVVHRDLKPDNLILEPDPASATGFRVRILDFGIARLVAEQYAARRRLTGVGSFMGTPDFMAPEQGIDASQVTDLADVFSVGVILYYLLGGQLPVVRPLLPVGSPKLMALLAEMTVFLGSQRPSMSEVGGRLRALASTRPQPRPRIAWLGAGALVLGVALTVHAVTRDPVTSPATLDQSVPGVRNDVDQASPSDSREIGIPPDLSPPPEVVKVDLSQAVLSDLARPIVKQPCPPHFTTRCVQGEGLTDEQRQAIAYQANQLRLPICSGQRLVLTKIRWYVPDLDTATTTKLVNRLEAYWQFKNYDLEKTPKEIVISCP